MEMDELARAAYLAMVKNYDRNNPGKLAGLAYLWEALPETSMQM
jgi:hypothetical protein